MPASAFTSRPHSIIVLWQVLFSHSSEGRRLSWPEYTGERSPSTNRLRHDRECYFLDQAVYTKYLQLEKALTAGRTDHFAATANYLQFSILVRFSST